MITRVLANAFARTAKLPSRQHQLPRLVSIASETSAALALALSHA